MISVPLITVILWLFCHYIPFRWLVILIEYLTGRALFPFVWRLMPYGVGRGFDFSWFLDAHPVPTAAANLEPRPERAGARAGCSQLSIVCVSIDACVRW